MTCSGDLFGELLRALARRSKMNSEPDAQVSDTTEAK
jgi:hypothetical protein